MRNRHCIWIETRNPQRWVVRGLYLFISSFTFLFKYFILLFEATSHIWGDNSNSRIWVGIYDKPYIGIGILIHTRVCLEVNTHMGTLDYFIICKHIKDRVVNVPKDVYFEYFDMFKVIFSFNKHSQCHIWTCLKSTFLLINILKFIFGYI
jgi:hypothetical protein